MEDHKKNIKRCLHLAKKALDNGNPPVGAILVFDDKIIGEGIEAGKSTGDITNHAEILAIKDAIKSGYAKDLNQTILYTTHEPCIMCSYLIRHHKIPHIIFGTSVEHIGGFTSQFNILSTEEVPKWEKKPKVTEGICKAECEQLTEQFNKLVEKKE